MLSQTQLLDARVTAEDILSQCYSSIFVPIARFLALHKSVVLLAASTPENTFLTAAEQHVGQAIARVVDRSSQRYVAHYIHLAVQVLLAAEKLDGQGSADEQVRRPTDPNIQELLATVADLDRPLVLRTQAANELSYQLRGALSKVCGEIFPDFYEDPQLYQFTDGDYLVCHLGSVRRMSPDTALTPERDAALYALGFTHFGQGWPRADITLGLCEGPAGDVCSSTGELP